MKKITVLNNNICTIIVSFNVLKDISRFYSFRKEDHIMIITDKNVYNLYINDLYSNLKCCVSCIIVYVLSNGEKQKNIYTVINIMNVLIKKRYDKNSILIALGGGAVGDLTGLVASIYKRGIRFIYMPTTLLSQVDAAIGGKNCVNHNNVKNVIGTYYQPSIILIDLNCISTLRIKQISSGLAEVIKYSILFSSKFFKWLEDNIINIFLKKQSSLKDCVNICCKLKAKIISIDEKEKYSYRTLLNFGHTFGHAIESFDRKNSWTHGEAVSVGMIISSKISEKLGYLDKFQTNKIMNLLSLARLPVKSPNYISHADYIKYILHDKKLISNKIDMVLPFKIGKCLIYKKMNMQTLQYLLSRLI